MKLRSVINDIVKHKDAVLMGVMADPEVRKIIYKYNLEESLISKVIVGVHSYFIQTLKDNELLGSCPVAIDFIQNVKRKNFAIEDLFMLCIHIRENLIKQIFNDAKVMNELSKNIPLIDLVEEILLDVNTIFDANLSSVLRTYYETLTSLVAEYNKAVDASNIVSKTDPNGVITYVNDEFCRISGYTANELIGKSHNIVRHPYTCSDTFKNLWETIQDGKIWKGTIENLSKSGQSYYVNATIVPILDVDGNIIEYIGIRHDITSLVNHEKQMAVMREKLLNQSVVKAFTIQYQDVVNAIPLPSVILNENDYLVLANELFWSLFKSVDGSQIVNELKAHKRTFGSLLTESKECVTDSTIVSWRDIAMSLDEGQCVQICLINDHHSRFETKINQITNTEQTYYLSVMRPKES